MPIDLCRQSRRNSCADLMPLICPMLPRNRNRTKLPPPDFHFGVQGAARSAALAARSAPYRRQHCRPTN
ncbi:hypothetical protein IFO70_29990 [Phormidium tenue FACHB-886]|nr:hypothetical protein [Phormidium tenue FACHB-886]